MFYDFKSSFKDNWDLREFNMGDISVNLTRELSSMKLKLINFGFQQTKKNEIFVVCDIDILFYKPCIPLILEQFENKQKVLIKGNIYEKNIDIIFQKENCHDGNINLGFMAIENNEKSKYFFEKIYTNLFLKESSDFDQQIANELLHEKENNYFLIRPRPVRERNCFPKDENNVVHYINNDPNLIWDTFPIEIWNRSIGLDFLSKNIHLHHANCAKSKKDKYDQFKYIKELIEKK
jgi:hypothetical protein